MRDIEILLPSNCEVDNIAQATDAALFEVGLRVTMRDTFKKYPGRIYWHAKHGCETRTLEVTFWPKKRRVWFTVQSGRNAL